MPEATTGSGFVLWVLVWFGVFYGVSWLFGWLDSIMR